jgi:quercetin dioxygenase-like cupin family protein
MTKRPKRTAAGIALADALRAIPERPNRGAAMLAYGSVEVEFYQPHSRDDQKPHLRDEIYVIARGAAVLDIEGNRFSAKTGDVLFVPAHAKHHFLAFSEEFATWVFFYGPDGGEGPDPEAPAP